MASLPTTQTEGVRVPMWISTLLVSIVIPASIAFLGENPDWKAISVEALITASVLLGGVEVARKNTFSKAKVQADSERAYEHTYSAAYLDGYKDGGVDGA